LRLKAEGKIAGRLQIRGNDLAESFGGCMDRWNDPDKDDGESANSNASHHAATL